MKNLPQSEMIESCSVAGPGFVNVVLSKNWMAQVFGNCPIFFCFHCFTFCDQFQFNFFSFYFNF